MRTWDPEIDACSECHDCFYFLHDYWNCQGEKEPCHEFIKNKYSKKVETKTSCGFIGGWTIDDSK